MGWRNLAGVRVNTYVVSGLKPTYLYLYFTSILILKSLLLISVGVTISIFILIKISKVIGQKANYTPMIYQEQWHVRCYGVHAALTFLLLFSFGFFSVRFLVLALRKVNFAFNNHCYSLVIDLHVKIFSLSRLINNCLIMKG